MPQSLCYSPAQIVLEHSGIAVYHVYKDDDRHQCPREFWFDTREDSEDDLSFDVREIQRAFEAVTGQSAPIEAILRWGIDAGLITRR